MKKSILKLTTLTLIASLPALADMHDKSMINPSAGHAGGIYGGVMVGYLSGSSKVKKTMLVGPDCHDDSDVAGSGITGGIFLGYKKVFANQVFFAPEIFATKNSLSGKVQSCTDILTNEIKVKVNSEHTLGIIANIGRKMGMASPFIRIGAVFGRWKSRYTSQLIGRGRSSKTRHGIEVGAGSDFKVTDRACIGFFFAHRHYSSFKYNVLSDSDNNSVTRVRVRPGSNIFMLRLVFKK